MVWPALARSQFHRRAVAELDSLGRAQFVSLSRSAERWPDLLVLHLASEGECVWPAEMADPRQAVSAQRPEKLLLPELYLA